MSLKRMNIGFSPAMIKAIDVLAHKWGLDPTNTVRHCVALVLAQEKIDVDTPSKRRPRE